MNVRFFEQVLTRRYAFTLFYALLMLFGWLAFRGLAVEQLPNAELPSITVSYSWGRTSPEVMEQEITRKVEQIASRLPGVQEITSRSAEGSSSVSVTFQKSVSINLAQIEWTENLKALDSTLPLEVRRNEMSRSVPDEIKGMQSFISYSVSGPYSAYTLKEIAEERIKLPLSGLDGLAKISLNGVLEPVLSIRYKANLWSQLGLQIGNVASELSQRFQWQGAGMWRISGEEFALLAKPMPAQLDSIRAFSVKIGKNRWTSLGDIAEIVIEDYPSTYIRRINGEQALTVEFVKETGSDALSLAETIHSNMTRIQSGLPEGIILRLEKDATEQIRNEINSLTEQALYSIGFVFILLLVMIRRIRAPILILSNILFSLLFACIGMSILGETLNTFTMAALTISIGMLVDNAIVVYEHLEKKILPNSKNLKQEIIHESVQVIIPVFGNTLTTIGIFLPLIFSIPSLRYFLEPFGIALGFALLGSVIISMTWIPFLFQFMRVQESNKKLKRITPMRFWMKFWLIRYRLRWVITAIFILLIGFPTYLIPDLKDAPREEASFRMFVEEIKPFLNEYLGGLGYRFYNNISFNEPWKGSDSENLSVSIRTPVGTPIQELDKIAKVFEKVAKPFQASMKYSESYLNESSGAYLTFVFDKEALFAPEPYMLKGELMYLAARTGNSSISVFGFGDGFSNSGFGGGNEISLELTGYNYEELQETAELLKRELEKNSRVRNVDINQTSDFWRDDLFHYVMKLDNQKLMQLGINRAQLLAEIRADVSPDGFYGRITYDHKPMFVRAVNVDASARKEDFMQELRLINGVMIRLNEVSTMEKEKTLAKINRKNQQYSRMISFEFLSSWERGRTYQKELVAQFMTPIGIKLQIPDYWSRFRVDQKDETSNRWYVFVGSLVIVLLILAGLLNRWKPAFATMNFVVLGFLGVIWTALHFDLAFGRGAYAGILLLGGVIVNNGLLLYHERLSLEEKGVRGLRNGLYVMQTKLRSIWLTTLTTIAGLIPLLIWSTDPFWSGMALIVCAGMGFSTLMITLFWGCFTK